MNKGLWILSCVLLILGILFLAAGSILQFYLNRKESFHGRTTARVVDLLLKEADRKDTKLPYKNCCYPVLEYYAEGQLYKAVYPHGAYPSPFQLNQEVKLKYNKKDPQEYLLIGKQPRNYGPLALNITGIAGIAAGCIIFVIFALRG